MTSSIAPVVSIIVPAYNAAETIKACIEAARNQSWRGGRLEVVVVSDGSTDITAELARQAGADRVIEQPHAGPGAARNAGLAASQGDILLFVDADCAPAPDFVERMLDSFADPAVDGAKGAYRTRQRDLIARFVQIEYEDKYRRLLKRERIDFIDSYAAAYRRSALIGEGERGFDVGLAAAEDVELSFRLAQAGRKLVFNPRAYVYHHHRTSLLDYIRRKFRYGFWRARVYRRYPRKVAGDSHTPPVMVLQLPLASIAAGLTALSVADGRWRWLAGLAWAGILVTTLPFMRRSFTSDPAAALIAPFMLAVRSLALAAGLACGAPFALLYNREKHEI